MSTNVRVSIRVRLLGPLQAIAGRREVSLSLPIKTNVAELATLLLEEFGQQAEILVDPETGEFRGQFRVLHNGKYVNVGEGGRMLLQDGDTVSLLPVIGGGYGTTLS